MSSKPRLTMTQINGCANSSYHPPLGPACELGLALQRVLKLCEDRDPIYRIDIEEAIFGNYMDRVKVRRVAENMRESLCEAGFRYDGDFERAARIFMEREGEHPFTATESEA